MHSTTKMYTFHVCFVICGIFVINVTSECNKQRTTKELKNLFIGKCLYFQNVINPESFCQREKNCTELWELFKSSFANRSRCDVNRENYRAFIAASQHSTPPNKHIFWEDVYSLVIRYTNQGRRLISIADTLPGYLGDNLKWCGSTSAADGIEADYQNCPGYELLPNCKSSAERAFWTIASEYYAKQASGKIYVMMNAANQPSFSNTSYFATVELPNINPSKVHTATVLMVHELNKPARETCGSQSIRTLLGIFENKGIKSDCIDNPNDVMFMQCADNPSHEECKKLITTNAAPFICSKWVFSLLFFMYSLQILK